MIVDDTIVRGSTTRQITSILFAAGATEVHVRVSAPPVVSPCFYGIDFPDTEQLVAAGRSLDEVRDLVGATSLAHLSLDGMQARHPASRVGGLPRLLHAPLPDGDAARQPARQAPVRGVVGARAGRAPTLGGRYCSRTRLAFAMPREMK